MKLNLFNNMLKTFYITISGINWKVEITDKVQGGCFYWKNHSILIQKDYSPERKFQTLLHEICEIILTDRFARFQKPVIDAGNGDYIFVFNHDVFEMFVCELSGILNNLMKNKIKKGGEKDGEQKYA